MIEATNAKAPDITSATSQLYIAIPTDCAATRESEWESTQHAWCMPMAVSWKSRDSTAVQVGSKHGDHKSPDLNFQTF